MMNDPSDNKNLAPSDAPDPGAQGENPVVKKRWFGRGIYGSKDVPIRVLDACIGVMIAAALILTFVGAINGGFSITFDTGVDDLTVASQKIRHGGTITEPEAPVRPGYVLTGWSTTPEPEVHLWNFQHSQVEGDMKLYAVWEPASFEVKFDLGGGTVDGSSEVQPVTVTYGEAYGELPVPEKEGAEFGGWVYSGQTITADTTVTMTGEHVLTAVWN